MHHWGDDWFDEHGNELLSCAVYIDDQVRKWTKCRLHFKEKYGTIRYEYMFPPGFKLFYQRSKIRHWWCSRSRITHYWAQFGWWVCGLAIKRCIKNYPHLEQELCMFYSFGKFGKECNKKYWRKC